jgi:hypothetical protein
MSFLGVEWLLPPHGYHPRDSKLENDAINEGRSLTALVF